MPAAIPPERPDLTRRDFVKTLGATALVAAGPLVGQTRALAPGETPVARFHASLTDDQKAQICFPFDHPLRTRVRNNWAIVKPRIADLNPEQKALCEEVFKNLCSEDGHERFLRQMREDYGGFANYHVALFGEPKTEKPFEWVLTGRHATLRADGNRADGASTGGPIFYGHAAPRFHEGSRQNGNVWWYQAERANAIFKTLDHTHQARALVSRISRRVERDLGLSVGDLDGPQKAMVGQLLEDLLSPFRSFAHDSVPSSLRDVGALRLTYFQEGDPGFDGVRDVWKLEGPAFSWYFHGTPHVHAWLNIGRKMAGA